LSLLFGDDAHHRAIRRDCLARLPHEPRPITPDRSFAEGSGQLRENRDESFVTFSRIQTTGRWPLLVLAINCSARESHYSYRKLFCNSFFRSVSTGSQTRI